MKRKLFEDLKNHLRNKEHTILTGARQTGKTTLLKQLFEHNKKTEKYSFYLSFEDMSILEKINTHPERIFNIINIDPENISGRIYIFADEVQYAANPSNFLKLLYDKYENKIKIIATGSSAFYVDKKFKDSLAGRKKLFELFTLEFDEFLEFKGYSELKDIWVEMKGNKKYIPVQIETIKKLFEEFLIFGGYPKVTLTESNDEKASLLSELVNTYIKRDIYESKISNEIKFYNLLRILAGSTGGLLNINELANTLKISNGTIENYLYILQKCFHISLIYPFSRNIRSEISKMPKIYFNDIGLRNSLLHNFQLLPHRQDKGNIIENYAFTRFRQKYNILDINFWRTTSGNEIDFVISEMYDQGFAAEIKYNYSQYRKNKFNLFRKNYPNYNIYCFAFESQNPEFEIIRI